jgi:hypothetical protein
MVPAIVLFLLAPLFGEFLLGNLPMTQLYLLPFLAPLYGGGAILIREVTRRAGRGYPTMLVLGVAYALIEEALVDQMLFNPDYFTGQRELMQTVVPGIGVDAWLTLVVVAMHAVWSTCIPIVIVESLFARRGSAPWLGWPGLVTAAVVFVGGSAWLTYTVYDEQGFFAAPARLGLATAVIIALIVVAFAAFRPHRTTADGTAPRPVVVAVAAAVASSGFMLTEELPGWLRVVACLLVATVFLRVLSRWSRAATWQPRHSLAAATGGVLTYAWLGAVMQPETGPRTGLDHAGTALLVAFALALLLLGRSRLARAARSASTPDPARNEAHAAA